MPRGKYVDHDAVHRALWERSDRLGRITLNQTALAQTLGITKFTMSRVVSALIEQERISQISKKGKNMGLFKVTDPAHWAIWGDDK